MDDDYSSYVILIGVSIIFIAVSLFLSILFTVCVSESLISLNLSIITQQINGINKGLLRGSYITSSIILDLIGIILAVKLAEHDAGSDDPFGSAFSNDLIPKYVVIFEIPYVILFFIILDILFK